jgi:hypothetical protein
MINKSAAAMFFGAEDPIGKHISLGPAISDAEVIAIVGDIRQLPDSAPSPITYVSSTQYAPAVTFVFVRTMEMHATQRLPASCVAQCTT